ncbi:MAG: serine/threonine-protein phosphatase, partial [Bacteroidales bacterium]|nr:serine/threonine-protein phosphatase [Bacteroidales bacterium]
MGLFRKKENNEKKLENVEQPEANEPIHTTGFYSDKGRRANQEDSFLITDEYHKRRLILVADGLGGQEYGEFASNLTTDVFKNFFVQSESFDSPESFLTRTTLVAASMLMNKSTEDENLKDSATTLTGFMIIDNIFYTINVGDSRVYMFSDNKLTRKTKDHSFVQHLIDTGEITLEDAFSHPKKNLVTSIISNNITKLKTSIEGPFNLKEGDILIACSDGVHDALRDAEIEKIIANNQNADNLAEIIGKASYDAESKDNITACFYK